MKRLIALLLIVSLVLVGCSQAPIEEVLPTPPPDNMTWITPAKVQISNFYAGARAEYIITVHNGNDEDAEFLIGYVNREAPEEAQNWVIVSDMTPILEPRETRDIDIFLVMPDGAVAPSEWEFGISVKDISQSGMVQVGYVSRCLVSMRD